MTCNCTKVFPIPTGASNVTLGQYVASHNINVIFKTATGRKDVFQVTCDSSGNIIMPFPQLRRDTLYDVSIAEQSDATQTPVQWTIGGVKVNCISVSFTPEEKNDAPFTIASFQVTINTK